jgi:hypothetical protein
VAISVSLQDQPALAKEHFVTKSMLKAVVLFALFAAVVAKAQNYPKLPHFNHIVIIVQENRTPDNLFGANPGNGAVCGAEDPFEAAAAFSRLRRTILGLPPIAPQGPPKYTYADQNSLDDRRPLRPHLYKERKGGPAALSAQYAGEEWGTRHRQSIRTKRWSSDQLGDCKTQGPSTSLGMTDSWKEGVRLVSRGRPRLHG